MEPPPEPQSVLDIPLFDDRKVEMSLDLGSDPAALGGLEALLTRIVEASGGHAGVLSTWDVDHPEHAPRTSTYNLDAPTAHALADAVERSARVAHGRAPSEAVTRLEDDAREATARAGLGSLQVMAIPVRLHDRNVGLLCLLHPDDAPALLRDSPGTYNLRIDQVDLVVQNARLLQRLLHERRWLEAAVHHSASAILILDRQGLVVGFNVAMERLSGWTLDEAVGKSGHGTFPLTVSHGAASVTDLARASAHPAGDEPATPVEALLRTRDGAAADVEVSGTGLRDERGHMLGWVVTMRDIRARKEKERLERLFLSGVSHELQTPIAVIRGFAGLLSDPEVTLSERQIREKAAIIAEESERLERMVRQMLDATRIQAGGVQLDVEPVDLDGLARRVLHKLEPLCAAAGCAVALEAPPALEPVLADAARVEQVLNNLVENALKYGGGAVRVILEDRPAEIEVSVVDHGPGITGPDRDRIFQPFERAGAQRVRGAGLGLFICKAIVDAHGGHIGVEPAAGGGSRFFFALRKVMP